jgi:hypothetical protein
MRPVFRRFTTRARISKDLDTLVLHGSSSSARTLPAKPQILHERLRAVLAQIELPSFGPRFLPNSVSAPSWISFFH